MVSISACYIVKNEAENLPASIESVRKAADEIIVVDTGSDDNTVEAAKNLGANVFYFKWRDDFAAAKNFAVDHAAGDWIIFPDADEVFVDGENLRGAVMDFINEDTDAIMVTRRNIDPGNGDADMGDDWALRIFRHDSELRFKGRIHENVVRDDGDLRLAYGDSRLKILHTGYSEALIRKKAERNLALIIKDMEENGENGWHDLMLSDTCFILGEWLQALKYSFRALASPVRAVAGQSKLFHVAIESLRQVNGSLEEMERLARSAIGIFPSMPEFHGELGMILCGMGRLAEAKDELQTAVSLYEYPPDVPIHENRYFTPATASIVYARIGEIRAIFGDDEGARAAFEKALSINGNNENARRKFNKFLVERENRASGEGAVMNFSSPFISACYIVKNEAKNISRSIESIRDAADEIIVADTGSSDNTAEIAEKCGARVVRFNWRDDFSAARNFVMGEARGDWIIFIDADEFFTDKSSKNLRSVIENAGDHSLILVSRAEFDAVAGEIVAETFVPRIMRRGLHYEGIIHEEPRTFDGVTPDFITAPKEELTLIHTGYSSDLMKEKGGRNIALLKKELASGRARDTVTMYLAETYDGLGDEENALKYARIDVAKGRHGVIYASRSYRVLLRLLSKTDAMGDERLKIAAKAAKDFPELPEFHAEYAERLSDHLDFTGAVKEGEAALSVAGSMNEPSQIGENFKNIVRDRIALWQKILKRAGEIKICACLIAKNEEKDIAKWLKNTAVYADTRIVADTGSVDGTAETARRAGCEVFDFKWNDDFSAAKNFALEKAEGDWITFLDADETFFAPETLRPFLAMIDICYKDANAIESEIINIDEDDGGRETQRFMTIRVFRNGEGLRYAGRIHETLPPGSVRIFRERRNIAIRHIGYSTGRIRKKVRRNLDLILEDIASGKSEENYYHYLAECYAGLSEWSMAEKYARLAIKSPIKSAGSSNNMYHVQIAALMARKAENEELIPVIEEARRRFPLLPEYHAWYGIVMEKDDAAGAKRALLRAISLYEHPEDLSGEASGFADLAPRAYTAAARIMLSEGEPDMAAAEIEKALLENRYDGEALEAFYEIQQPSSAEEFFDAVIQKFDGGKPDLIYLARWAENYGHISLYLLISKKLESEIDMPRQDLYEIALAGKTEELLRRVLPELARTVEELPLILLYLERDESQGALYEKIKSLLPLEMEEVWRAYEGGRAPDAGLSGAFGLMVPKLARHGDAAQIDRFAAVAEGISSESVISLAVALYDEERWQEAFSVYGHIKDGDARADGEFWRRVGICLYHMGEYGSAEECFKNAEAAGNFSPDMRAYRKWMAENV